MSDENRINVQGKPMSNEAEIISRLELFVGGLGKAILRELKDALAEKLTAQQEPVQKEPSDAQIALLDPWMRPAAAKELLSKVLALSQPATVHEQVTDAEKLATAIAEAAARVGITDASKHSFSGPQLLLLLDNLVELASIRQGPVELMKDAAQAIFALREWVEAVPDEVQLPAMPGVDADWLDKVESNLKSALAAPMQEKELVRPMVEKTIYEAELVELDYCVAQHQFPEWKDVQRRLETVDFLSMGDGHEPYTPTLGGKDADFLLENEIDQLTRCRINLSKIEWEAVAIGNDQISATGPTAHIAMVRCFLLQKNGTEKIKIHASPLGD